MENTDAFGPQGFGYGSVNVTNTTGSFALTGRLPDGTALTGSSFVGPQGQALIYKPLYGNKGSVIGSTVISLGGSAPVGNTLGGVLLWSKPPGSGTIYAAGFPAVTLACEGGYYAPLAPGGRVMGLMDKPLGTANAKLDFTLGGLDTESLEFKQLLRVYNPSATGRSNKAQVLAPISNGVKLTTFNAATGEFVGEFTLPGPPARKAPLRGIIAPTAGGTSGFGYFLLPQKPIPPKTATTAPKLSGRVELLPTP